MIRRLRNERCSNKTTKFGARRNLRKFTTKYKVESRRKFEGLGSEDSGSMLTEIRDELSSALKMLKKEYGTRLPDLGETMIAIQPTRRWGYSYTFRDYVSVSVNEFLRNPKGFANDYKDALDKLSKEAEKWCDESLEDALDEIARREDMEIDEVREDEDLFQEAEERASEWISSSDDCNTGVYVTWRFDKMIYSDWFALPEEIVLGEDFLVTDFYTQQVDSADDLGWSSDWVKVTDAEDIVKELVKNNRVRR